MNLKHVYSAFPDRSSCLSCLERHFWARRPACPYCGSKSTSPRAREARYHCNSCNAPFSVTVNTVLSGAKADLQKVLLLLILIKSTPKRTVRELAILAQVSKTTVLLWQNRARQHDEQVNGLLRHLRLEAPTLFS